MTAICGGGTSQPQVGSAAVVDYSAGLIAAIFAVLDIAWLIPAIPLVGLAPLILNTFCASDPPAVPTFTFNETDALLNLKFGANFDSGLSKLKDFILNAIWYDACQCTAGVPTPLVAPSPPAGTPIIQYPTGQTGTPCLNQHFGPLTMANGQQFGRSGANAYGKNVTYVECFASNTLATGAGCRVNASFAWQNTLVTPIQTSGVGVTITLDPGQSLTRVCPLAPGYNSLQVTVAAVQGTGTSTVEQNIKFYCDGAMPGVDAQPCCPPDPATNAYLDNILQLVTLIQRQLVPFAHLLGPVHAGLTGQGSIGVNGLLGVKMDLTTIPGSYGVQVGSPNYHFDLGWLSVLTADGFIDERRLTAQLTAWMPRMMSDATVIGYSLNPGVVGTLTEMVREP